MIDGTTIISTIPPLLSALFTYIIANKHSRIQYTKLLSNIQSKAIEQVRLAEEKMRLEIWSELEKVREQNDELKQEMKNQRNEIIDLRKQLDSSTHLRITLTEQVHSLESLVETYKLRITELENKN